LITANLPSGYFRDMQLIKEIYLPVFDEMIEIIKAMHIGTSKLQIRKEILENPLYDCIFTVEKVNEYVLQGKAFRDAYVIVAKQVEEGNFKPDRKMHHTHEGSMGNLCNDKIKEKFDKIFGRFDFESVRQIEKRLLRFE
jgi:argininosuccinate lyase